MNIDQDRYNKLADWAESDEREIDPTRGETGRTAVQSSRELIRRARRTAERRPHRETGHPHALVLLRARGVVLV